MIDSNRLCASLETQDTRRVALGALVFAGGFSLGVEQAGFRVAGHLEHTDVGGLGVAPARRRWPVVEGTAAEWLDLVQPYADRIDFGYANPPCVAYAGPGKHEGTTDERMCFLRYAAYDLFMKLMPTVWAWELVPGILTKDRSFLEAMAFRASRLGYKSYGMVTSSALHGGYQDRRRFHFVASRVELDFRATLNAQKPHEAGVKTLGECLAELSIARRAARGDDQLAIAEAFHCDPERYMGPTGIIPNDEDVYFGAFKSLFPYLPPGTHLNKMSDEALHRHYRPRATEWSGSGRPGFTHVRGRLDYPSPNIVGGYSVIHPIEDRYLTPREAASVMGFPTDYELSPGITAYREVGKGLCVHNARFLAQAAMQGLDAGIPVKPDHKLQVVDLTVGLPPTAFSMSREAQIAWLREKHGVDDPTYVVARG